MQKFIRPLRVFTWHIHGSYLYYLTQTPCIFYVPYKKDDEEGYGGCFSGFPWGDNIINVPADEVKDLELDCILFQSKKAFLFDQFDLFSPEQRKLPKIYLEHDPPRESPTDTKHIVNDPSMLIVHVTDFNRLMWNNNETPSTVIDHGVLVDEKVQYTGELKKGIVVINGLARRGRRLGLDIFNEVKQHVPLDLVGMWSNEAGGIGEIPHNQLNDFTSKYRFFFNPIRYTSLGLAVCEAMMTGMPVVGMATTEMVTAIKNNETGFIETNIDKLIEKMQLLLNDHELAKRLGNNAKAEAKKRFNIERFKHDWLTTLNNFVSGFHLLNPTKNHLNTINQ